uniref:Major facilitator superfamily (MFS) profile domain-containing protein n=1 Tax=Timema shepardi TaxID=629360 RepID=A0A7R9B5Y9_TIMSH|nr:unnamed protein product [Timema shepardi]
MESEYEAVSKDAEVEEELPLLIKVYPRRWGILAVFFSFSVVNSFQWIQYGIIADVVARHYQIPLALVDWTRMVFMACFIVLILPACYALDKMGLRWCVEVGAILTAAGAWLKVVGVPSSSYWLAMLGQTIVGSGEVFVLGMPPKLASLWFGPDQISTACSIIVLGSKLGAALGFFLPPVLVRDHLNRADIGPDLKVLQQIIAGSSTLVLVLIIIFLKDKPPLPPSLSQAQLRSSSKDVTIKEFLISLKRLLTSIDYHLLLWSFGINYGVLNAVCTLPNQLILSHFPGGQEFTGRVCLTIIVAGMLGAVVFGVLLDKTHKYKETTLGVYILTMVSLVGFTFILGTKSTILVYLTAATLGVFLGGYIPVAYELGAELTYPLSEGTVTGVMLIPGSALGILFTTATTAVLEHWGDVAANMVMCGALVLGAALTAGISRNYYRLRANTLLGSSSKE